MLCGKLPTLCVAFATAACVALSCSPSRPRGCLACSPNLEAAQPPGNEPAESYASVPLFPPRHEGDARRRPDRQPQADAARRPRPPDRRRHLCLAADRPSRAQQDRADRARGAGPGRSDRTPHADHPVGRPVAPVGPLRRLWPGDAAFPRPARARDAVRADQRGDDHRASSATRRRAIATCRARFTTSSGSSATRCAPASA